MRERWNALVFLVAWFVSLAAVWTAASALLPRATIVVGPVDAHLVVDGPNWTVTYEADTKNATAFGLLLEASVVQGFHVTWVDYGWPYEDVYIMSIRDAHEGEGGRSWQYCVNGAYATVGALHQSLHAGDLVRWVFAAPGGNELCG